MFAINLTFVTIMRIIKRYSLLLSLGILLFGSCVSKDSSLGTDQAELIPADTLCFPINDSTHYESKAMFQFEYSGREYLFFQNQRDKGSPHISIFDIEKECLYKSIPVYKEGPNGIPHVLGGWPLDMDHFIVTTGSTQFYMIDDAGHITYKSPALYVRRKNNVPLYDGYCGTRVLSYYASPAIFRDSLFYFPQKAVGFPHTADNWSTSNLFAYMNMNTGELGRTKFCYPSVFDKAEDIYSAIYGRDHSYADTGKDVAVSFEETDSIYVSSDFHHVRAYNAKSRYFPHLRPEPENPNQDLLTWIRKDANTPQYHHLLYDKYRKVFYRFACMPYEYPELRSPMDEDTGREFSIIILNDKYEIIGETRFPGNTYAYRLWFIGRDGLYLSLNNQGNPDFDEDRLLFRRLKLEYKK
ncbi:MAG: DUF4221 family protein [Bacteroidales bacterium]|nr:DUF4221 family protein [Bacteroidales bacterium]